MKKNTLLTFLLFWGGFLSAQSSYQISQIGRLDYDTVRVEGALLPAAC